MGEIIGSILGFVVVLVIWITNMEKKQRAARAAEMERCAQMLGFSFAPTGKKYQGPGDLHLFGQIPR